MDDDPGEGKRTNTQRGEQRAGHQRTREGARGANPQHDAEQLRDEQRITKQPATSEIAP